MNFWYDRILYKIGSDMVLRAVFYPVYNESAIGVQWYCDCADRDMFVFFISVHNSEPCRVELNRANGFPPMSRMEFVCFGPNSYALILKSLTYAELGYTWGASFIVNGPYIPYNLDFVKEPVPRLPGEFSSENLFGDLPARNTDPNSIQRVKSQNI